MEKWRNEAERIIMELECETEDASFNTLSAREFIKAQTFTEAKVADLRTACNNHSKRMLGFMKQVNSIKLKDFLTAFALGENTKVSVKNEFKRFNDHIMIIQKHVNEELSGIMKELADSTTEENKPTPAIQPSGTEI